MPLCIMEQLTNITQSEASALHLWSVLVVVKVRVYLIYEAENAQYR